jgi:serine phosphatase RsbU (regulator of sigma subunit)
MGAPIESRERGLQLSSVEFERRAARRWFWLPTATLIVGLLVTGALAWVSQAQYASNEKRLLGLRVRDAGSLLIAAVPTIQTPLASAAELADATRGNPQRFKRLVAPYVGNGPGRQFASVSLWRLAATQAGPVAVEGAKPKLEASRSDTAAFFARTRRTRMMSVIGLLRPPGARLGYAFSTPGLTGGYVAYAESPLPANRRSRLQSSSAFAGLDYALYLGSRAQPQDLLVTDVSHPPLGGVRAAETVPFGNSALTLVMASRVSLAGSLPAALPWIIAIVGGLLSVGAAVGVMRLTERRRDAEQLAGRLEVTASENRQLYAEQHTIAQTLQHALLPADLPQVPGVLTSARYTAGERGVDVGGDWYDVIDLGDLRLLLVVGDVSGRGLRAATTMASLRYAIHAYAAQNDPPATILTKLGELLSVTDSGQLATILCAVVDVERREISVTSAGHLPPLLISDGNGRYIESEAGVPIGVEVGAAYVTTTISAPREATFVAFTDGLVEHRGENLDHGLARLRDVAARDDAPLPELLERLVSEIPGDPSEDDIAIVGVRWTS